VTGAITLSNVQRIERQMHGRGRRMDGTTWSPHPHLTHPTFDADDPRDEFIHLSLSCTARRAAGCYLPCTLGGMRSFPIAFHRMQQARLWPFISASDCDCDETWSLPAYDEDDARARCSSFCLPRRSLFLCSDRRIERRGFELYYFTDLLRACHLFQFLIPRPTGIAQRNRAPKILVPSVVIPWPPTWPPTWPRNAVSTRLFLHLIFGTSLYPNVSIPTQLTIPRSRVGEVVCRDR